MPSWSRGLSAETTPTFLGVDAGVSLKADTRLVCPDGISHQASRACKSAPSQLRTILALEEPGHRHPGGEMAFEFNW